MAGGEEQDRLAVAPPPPPRARSASRACGAPCSRGTPSRGGRTASSRPRSRGRARRGRSRRPRGAPAPRARPSPRCQPPGGVASRALPEHRDRLVDAAEHRALLLEHLHGHARVPALALEQLLREVEVGVRVVARADPLHGEPEHLRVEPRARARLGRHAPQDRPRLGRGLRAQDLAERGARPPRAAPRWARGCPPRAGSRGRACAAGGRARCPRGAPTRRRPPPPPRRCRGPPRPRRRRRAARRGGRPRSPPRPRPASGRRGASRSGRAPCPARPRPSRPRRRRSPCARPRGRRPGRRRAAPSAPASGSRAPPRASRPTVRAPAARMAWPAERGRAHRADRAGVLHGELRGGQRPLDQRDHRHRLGELQHAADARHARQRGRSGAACGRTRPGSRPRRRARPPPSASGRARAGRCAAPSRRAAACRRAPASSPEHLLGQPGVEARRPGRGPPRARARRRRGRAGPPRRGPSCAAGRSRRPRSPGTRPEPARVREARQHHRHHARPRVLALDEGLDVVHQRRVDGRAVAAHGLVELDLEAVLPQHSCDPPARAPRRLRGHAAVHVQPRPSGSH